jgi:predicted DCC family thiol-disulfide oxidoreductase YuxK
LNEYPYIVFYDGACGLCNRSVRFIIRHDKKEIFRFAALDSDFAKINLKTMEGIDSIVLLANSQSYLQSDAVLKIVSLLGYPSKFLLFFRIVPKPLRNWLYKWVARNRYEIWGKYDSCPIPTENQRKLFLDSR